MGSQGKHAAVRGSPRPSGAGKHADPAVRRAHCLRMLLGSGALAVAVVGGAVVLGQASAPPSSAGVKAVTVSSDDGPESRPSPPALERLVVYGHSMPAGGGASADSRGTPCWPPTSSGSSWSTTPTGQRLDHAALTLGRARRPDARDAVVLHTGLNDIFRRGEAAVDRGRLAIRRFLAGTAGAGRRVIFPECQPGWWQHTPAGRNLQPAYDAWNDMIREEAAAAPRVDVVDVCETWDPRRFASFPDFHPNDEGHARMAAALVAVLSRV